MAVRVRFVPVPSGVIKLSRDATIWPRHLERVTEQIAAEVVRNAPVHTGYFRSSIGTTPAHLTTEGWSAGVTTSDWGAHWVEFGSVNNPPYAPFRRALASSGLKIR